MTTRIVYEAERNKLDKKMMNELLLIVSVLGSKVPLLDNNKEQVFDDKGQPAEIFQPVTDCTNWLTDLQRACRRDDPDTRPIANQLGAFNVVDPDKKRTTLVGGMYIRKGEIERGNYRGKGHLG
jgi:hypothetical protein